MQRAESADGHSPVAGTAARSSPMAARPRLQKGCLARWCGLVGGVLKAWLETRVSGCRRRLTGEEASLRGEALLGLGPSPHCARPGGWQCVSQGLLAVGGGGLEADQTARGMRPEGSHLKGFRVVVSCRRQVPGAWRTTERSGTSVVIQRPLGRGDPGRGEHLRGGLSGRGRHPANKAGAAWGSPWWEVTSLAQKTT